MSSLSRLWHYFGIVGLASIGCWAASWLTLVWAACWRGRRMQASLAALVLSLAGLGLAHLNSIQVSQIEVDRSAEIEAARQRQADRDREAREKELQRIRSKAARVRFAEDGSQDAMDVAGLTSEEARKLREAKAADAATKAQAEPDPTAAPAAAPPREYGYRAQGKQTRQEGKQRQSDDLAEAAASPESSDSAIRRMSEPEVLEANRWDRANRLAARATPWVILLVILLDYLARFNRTAGCLYPLPISGHWLDSIFPKTHAVYLGPQSGTTVGEYLDQAIHKGETFIYLGPTDPVGKSSLPSLHPTVALAPWMGAVAVAGLGTALAVSVWDSIWRWEEIVIEVDGHAWVRAVHLVALVVVIAGTIFAARRPAPALRLGRVVGLVVLAGLAIRWGVSIAAWIMAWVGYAFAPWVEGLAQTSAVAAGLAGFAGAAGVLAGLLVRLGRDIWHQRVARRTKLIFTISEALTRANFILESAWFGRYCFVLTGEDGHAEFLEALLRFLASRQVPGARAGRTVHVVWHRESPPPSGVLEELAYLAREANFKLVISSSSPPAQDFARVMDECLLAR